MRITSTVAQLRTTDLAASVRFYTETLGFTLAFQYQDFYAGIRAGDQLFHLKLVDAPDPSIPFVRGGEHFHLYFSSDDVDRVATELRAKGVHLVREIHNTPWGTREFAITDDQGHTLYFGEDAPAA